MPGSDAPAARVPLGRAPRVLNAGVGIHGVGAAHDRFRLPHLWQLHLYGYTAEYAVDGTRMPIGPDTVSLVPPNTVVDYWYRGRSEHLYVHFDLPGAEGEDGPVHEIPVVQQAGETAGFLGALLTRAIRGHREGGAPAASAHAWSALWTLAELARRAAPVRHPAVEAATAYIEEHLADPLTVAGIARRCGVSHNHLTRLFAAEVGTTPVGYIRDRRMRRAHHLLAASTLPVATVAALVGIGDLQAFNKACRRAFGAPPRAIRAGLGGG